ncbi:protein-glutamate methylesterase/protein-glutamine glutaminase [Sulfuriflexus mobilis]|uniref:protein-glutamate methylesterase/protein-glutamine glutaminase n=1 Tax=Sulfuriflexus mobilis TaxID=1811807 RepID=UPI000F8332DB|nr:chemotaxis response regulator protein-glutamate methylesterase [Sulfuriflexus mobilis]
MAKDKIKVLIIDDSALVREVLTEILNADPNLEVIGTASDPIIARNKIKQLNPDVLTLDVEMPRMDGLTFLSNLMRLRPMPVVMVSSLTEKGADITLRALEMGAVDFVSKPKLDVAHGLKDYAEELCGKVKAASGAKLQNYSWDSGPTLETQERHTADAVLNKREVKNFKTTDRIIAIGASTGGTEAIKEVLMHMPADAPGIVITQHIPEAFSGPFAKRMDDNCAMTVYEATDGQQILPGHVYIAPGSHHMLVERSGARYICKLSDGPPVNRHRPAVDVMFRSVAQNVGPNAIGVILTGMGDDGAIGMKEMQEAGAPTIAQDEKTSVVWGMPGEAVKQGGVDVILALQEIPNKLIGLYK